MQKSLLFLSVIILIIASGLLFMKNKDNDKLSKPEIFLKEIHSGNRYLSTDDIAKRIINDDPTLFLVDVRNEEEFNNYSLPGAINIPFENILNTELESKLNQEVLDVVFYSNDDIFSEKAWALCVQENYSNLYVMEGGLNKWFATIMLPEKPGEMASSEEMDLYSFRTGASIYFGSGSVEVPVLVEVESEEPTEPEVKKAIPVQKKVKLEAEGGC